MGCSEGTRYNFVAVCCSVFQIFAVCCNMLQCVALKDESARHQIHV